MLLLLTKATLLLMAVLLLGRLLRRASASRRAALYTAGLLGLAALPILHFVAPPLISVPLPAEPLQPTPLLVRAQTQPMTLVAEKSVPVATTTQSLRPAQTSEPATIAEPAPFPWERLGIALLALGSVLCLVRLVFGLVGLQQLVRQSQPAPAAVREEVAALAQRLRLARVPQVRVAGDVLALASPLTFGWWRGVVLLPESSLADDAALRVALLHELVHLHRQDWLVLLLARASAALWWFHPLVHLLVRQLRAELEAACDDRVLRSGVPAPDYAGYLVSFARTASGGKS
jgi:beta-lactamase regulating signal transducer with metallopeptidase domain